MCDRFTQARPWSELVQLYGITESPSPSNLAPRYNVAPTQDIAVVRPTATCLSATLLSLLLRNYREIPA